VFTIKEDEGRSALSDSLELDCQLFSAPELEGFLRILRNEEEAAVAAVRSAYQMRKIDVKRQWKVEFANASTPPRATPPLGTLVGTTSPPTPQTLL
jgi:hypothetical protein